MIGVLLVTHGQLGRHLVDTVTGMLGELSLPTDVLEVHRQSDPDELINAARDAAARLDDGHGVLILTDAFGSTPSNIANRAADRDRHRVIAGVNLPMLVRIYNYPKLELDAMTASAVEAGRQGIMPCLPPTDVD
ncbi:PTS system fructose subfamily IIA component [Salinisphaera sp. PC39]|uniref:PTS sugar transporter subunit IIA n=1 Tax=Salinisphaera sp. PC39 TaxID=1304156 RepID=UPI00333E9A0C